MFFVSASFIGNLNAQISSFLLAILIKLLTSKFILQKAQIYYAPFTTSPKEYKKYSASKNESSERLESLKILDLSFLRIF
jgi:hypothetical protein